MADTTTPQAPAEEKPPEGEQPKEEPKPPEAPTEEAPTGKDGKPFDPERAQRALEAARANEKNAKDEAKELREKAAKFDELEAEKLSEKERLEKERDDALAKSQAADTKLQHAHLIVALSDSSLNIVNASAAARLIEGVEFDDDGKPTNLGDPAEKDSLLGKFLAENSYLRGNGKPQPPSVDAREGGDTPPPSLTAEELRMVESLGMSAEEYAKNK